MNKKILVSFVLIFAISAFLYFPLAGKAVSGTGPIMQLTVTLTNLAIPARAAINNLANAQTLNFGLISGWQGFVVVENENTGSDLNSSISVTAGSKLVTGTGTHFTSDFVAGDYITTINSTDANGNLPAESRKISSVDSNTAITTVNAWSNSYTNVTYSKYMRVVQVSSYYNMPPLAGTLDFPYLSSKPYSIYYEVESTMPYSGYANCPHTVPCSSPYISYDYIAVPPTSIIYEEPNGGTTVDAKYWRVLLQTIPVSS